MAGYLLHVLARAKCSLNRKGQNQYEITFDFLNTSKKQTLLQEFIHLSNLSEKIILHEAKNGFSFSRDNFPAVYNAFLPENLIKFKKSYDVLQAEKKKK